MFKNSRRKFLQSTGLSSLGIALSGKVNAIDAEKPSHSVQSFDGSGKQHFNMCGFAAPKLDKVRIAFIGTGNRGTGAVNRIKHIEGVEIKALCDIRREQAEGAKSKLGPAGSQVDIYTGSEDWKRICERDDIDLIYSCTPWELHTPIAVYAMEHDKHIATEIPAAKTIDECWELVETSERTRKHCVMLENCCYDFFELLTLNMARQGFFGEIIHGEGAYIHSRTKRILDKTGTTWRLEENMYRDGNLYPTHGFGPICQLMDINRGDKLDFLVSTSSNDFSYGKGIDELAKSDDFWKTYADKSYRGNMNTSTIRTTRGRTIMIQHDTSSPRVYSRIHLISGTKGSALKYPLPGKVALGHEGWLPEEEFKKLEDKYQPAIVKKVGEMAKHIGGHGGMDLLMDWRMIDCLRNGLPMDMDVYDAATWSALGPLSEWSVEHRSNSVDFPDFTRGSWITNQPVDISLAEGGTTGVHK
ncbi:UNVERIFIED_CONTAM: hypothetical protein GTU68_043909 [Idotea baltica]|nr:hypothetical protein [Idotea baltica]